MTYINISARSALMLGSAALATMAALTNPAPAYAQALNPVVDVCTGVSIDQSTVRDLLVAVNDPIVSPVETTFNALLGATVVIPGVDLIAPLDIDVTGIVDNAIAGNPIGVQVLDTNGNLVSPGSCNVTADGFTLNTEGGIAIGGNSITGLGANGQLASAGEVDAIAFGNNATTAIGATGAVALGTGANVSVANGVALGAGSTNDRAAMTGYTAFGIAGPVSSAGTVSIGAPGAERQLTNVAPGTALTDAATVGQVQGAIAAATADSVQYTDGTHTLVALDGAGGTRVTGVAAGTIAAGSTDAVNGSQLNDTNQQVAANTGSIAAVQGQVTANTTNITAVQAGVATNTADLAALDGQAVKYDDGTHDTVTFDAVGGTLLTNVAQGAVTASSTDAVTGAQLFATNQAIAAATGTPGLALTYDDPTLATATLGGAGGTTLDNVAAGTLAAGSMEAVNGGQLFATNQQVATNTTNIATATNRLDGIDAAVTSIDGRVTTNTTAITGIDGRVTQNTTQLAAVQAQVDNVPVGYVSDADGTTPSATPTDTAAFTGASGGAVRVTNVANGSLAAGSTDAVNGSQLGATNTQVAQNRADIVTISATIGAGSAAPLQYSNAATPTVANGGVPTQDVTLVGADPAQAVRVHNVAAGTAATDAVNLGQLQSTMTQVQGQIAQGYADSTAYTDMRIAEIGFDLNDLRKDAFSGTAAAMAMAAIPQTITAGESMVGGAVGHYRGETAFGFGFSTTAGERVVIKASGTFDTHGKGGVAAGAGFAF